LYTKEEEANPSQVQDLLDIIAPLFSDKENVYMLRVIEEVEIIQAIWSLDPEKSLGLDGFYIHFF